jgi:hypothetical protein
VDLQLSEDKVIPVTSGIATVFRGTLVANFVATKFVKFLIFIQNLIFV